jgi:hypothetical protein
MYIRNTYMKLNMDIFRPLIPHQNNHILSRNIRLSQNRPEQHDYLHTARETGTSDVSSSTCYIFFFMDMTMGTIVEVKGCHVKAFINNCQ